MPTPTIPDGELFFNATTYTGDGATTRSQTSLNFQPDFVWLKSRSLAINHTLFDSVRTAGPTKALYSNSTETEGGTSGSTASAEFGYISSFDSNGFSTSSGSVNGNYVNSTSNTYVAWQWKAGGAATTISVGQYSTSPNVPSIASSVSANTTSGFSVVTYTGNTINGATVGHGLGVTPSMIIVKNRSTSTLWSVYHASVGAASVAHLNDTAAFSASGDWDSTTPTPTVFTVGTSNRVNNANNYVAYCWAPVAGYSAFGSYTGNSSTDGPFIYTGFRPRFILFKNITQASQWVLLDSARNTYNVVNTYLETNTADSDNTSTNVLDMLSNGFKLRDSGGTDFNENANNYIYMAFAENPFKYANAR